MSSGRTVFAVIVGLAIATAGASQSRQEPENDQIPVAGAPGSAVGIIGWILASIGLRAYVHFFNNYTVTYGGLGAVIVLLTWFYLTGLMLLLGAEINSEIEAVAAAKRLLLTEQNSLARATAPGPSSTSA